MFYQLNEKAGQLESQGRRIIRMNVGKTCLPTPEVIVEKGLESMSTKKADYGPVAGTPALRKAIAEREGCAPENIVAGPGSKQLLGALILAFTRPGDRILIPSPHWPAYPMICRMLGRVPVEVPTSPENHWLFDSLPLQDASMLILCNPMNPSCLIYPEKLIDDTVEKAKKAGVTVIMDEAYRGLAFEKMKSPDCIRVRSFSKEFNMEGWRLGYVVASASEAEKLADILQLTVTCVPGFIQDAGIAALEAEAEILSQNLKIWRQRLTAAEAVLTKAGFIYEKPKSGIYVFMTHEAFRGKDGFCMDLLEKTGVAVAPGSCFGSTCSDYIRITLNQPPEILEEGLELIRRYMSS